MNGHKRMVGEERIGTATIGFRNKKFDERIGWPHHQAKKECARTKHHGRGPGHERIGTAGPVLTPHRKRENGKDQAPQQNRAL